MATVEKKPTSLVELNPSSAGLGTWKVTVYIDKQQGHGKTEYSYNYQGKQRQGCKFSCILVSFDKPEEYCLGEAKPAKGDRSVIDKAAATFTNGLTFKLSKVQLVNGQNPQYIHTPIKHIINLVTAHAEPCMKTGESPPQPAPSYPLTECLKLGSKQLFDLTALISKVGIAAGGGQRDGKERMRVD